MAPTFVWDTDNLIVDFQLIKQVRLGANDGDTTPAMTYTVIDSNAVAVNPTFTTLTTQGTVTTRTKNVVDNVDVTITNNAWAEALSQISMLIDSTPPGTVDRRYGWTGEAPSRYYALEVTYGGTDTETGDAVNLIRTFHKCSVKQPTTPTDSTAKQVTSQTTILNVIATDDDLLSADLGFADPIYWTDDVVVV